MRRRKAAGAAEQSSIPGDTTDEGAERWAGDPNEEPEPVAPAPAPDPPRKPDQYAQPPPWGAVVHHVFDLDVMTTFKRLEKELTLGDGATEYGTVLRAVDQGARNLYDAARLARKSKLEDEAFGIQLDKRLEVLRTAAQQALLRERSGVKGTKAPTIKDIEDRMLSSWPDEMTTITKRRAEMHGALRSIESLETAWKVRCSALEVIAAQFKRAGA